jgi:tungstate transport system substrate-binding protein
MKTDKILLILVVAFCLTFIACPATVNNRGDIILATTTSVQDSGLLDALIPAFNKESGFNIKPIAVGSGEAMAMGKRGDADVLFVHSPKAEEEFMQGGFGKSRKLLMTNYFVIVGPDEDPAGCLGSANVTEILTKIADKKANFVSRGDKSGTHTKELSLWKSANITPKAFGEWYIEAKTGMGMVLQVANEKRGYTLTDRATYLSFKSKLQLKEMIGKDEALINKYSVIVLNPEKFPKINLAGAEAWAKFLFEEETKKTIGEYGKDKYGESLFYPVENTGK